MREIYFEDQIDDNEYNHKFQSLEQAVPAAVSTLTNGQLSLAESAVNSMALGLRTGATLGERTVERSNTMEVPGTHAQLAAMLPKPINQPTQPGVYPGASLYALGGGPYGNLQNAAYLRQIGVGGGER